MTADGAVICGVGVVGACAIGVIGFLTFYAIERDFTDTEREEF